MFVLRNQIAIGKLGNLHVPIPLMTDLLLVLSRTFTFKIETSVMYLSTIIIIILLSTSLYSITQYLII